ncbi:MAG: exodeoxyribonuclease VII large subunit [Burkholderiaceae bacterium]|jgi:exodeoxyribonuclease VII large subunit|nr:exodeoxyribonuclease VII large subunit [Burkholderiaceae bacterium]
MGGFQPPEGELGPPAVSVSMLNRMVAQMLSQRLPLVRLQAEISQCTRASSGHCYLVLKDDQASLRAVMFRRELAESAVQPMEGLAVEALAAPGLYEPKGEFQVRLLALKPQGQGSLFEIFQRLKARLEAEGLFSAERKKPFPQRVRRLALVTSAQAAALRDILITVRRLGPRLEIALYPCLVQGAAAPRSILAAWRRAEASEPDAVILSRGGGSLEDLWAFNDEELVRAVAQCPYYTIAGVGHETDTSLVDFAADHRAATPTAAAAWACQREAEHYERLVSLNSLLRRGIQQGLRNAQQRLDLADRALPNPRHRVQAWARRLEQGRTDFYRAIRMRLRESQMAWQRQLQRLESLSPTGILSRGYCLAYDADGGLVSQVQGLHPGTDLRLQFVDGLALNKVISVIPDSPPGR